MQIQQVRQIRFPKSVLNVASLFWLVAALRFSAVPPFVIDDDEAWWSAASNSMRSFGDFYRSAVDHKPPGVVWFYRWVNHLIPCASDPRIVRAVYTALMVVASGILGWIAFEFAKRERRRAEIATADLPVGWLAATLFLLITAIPSPKLMAVTADGLIVELTIFAYALALFAELPGIPVLSGAILGMALLIKQTAVFFAVPILFSVWPRKWTWKEIAGFALGSMLVLVPSILIVDWHEFLYWNWTYPKQVLTAVRERLFHSNLEMIESLAMFAAAMLPLLVALFKTRFSLRDFRVLWFLSGIAAALLGKGLFLHYLLLFAPPFALLAAEALTKVPNPRTNLKWTFSWLAAQFTACVLILMIPISGIFWGADLGYFEQLGRVLRRCTRSGETVMVWGGSALPLTYSGAIHVTRFVLPRFAVEPYATERTRAIFHQELAQNPPDLVLDISERGDNRSNNTIGSEPFVANLVRGYRAYVHPSIPWAKFYFRHPVPVDLQLVEVKTVDLPQIYSPFPSERRSWIGLLNAFRELPLGEWADADWALRASAALELLARQGATPQLRAQAIHLGAMLTHIPVDSEIRSKVESFIRRGITADGIEPFPLHSAAWWSSVAVVELQPKAF